MFAGVHITQPVAFNCGPLKPFVLDDTPDKVDYGVALVIHELPGGSNG